ncbi:MAG: hypothetical protein ACFNLT_09930 [Eikenella halliae]
MNKPFSGSPFAPGLPEKRMRVKTCCRLLFRAALPASCMSVDRLPENRLPEKWINRFQVASFLPGLPET